MNLKQMRAAALKAAQDIIAKAKSEERDLTSEEQATVEAKFAEIEELDGKIEAAAKSADLIDRIGAIKSPEEPRDPGRDEPKSLGEHFVKSVGARMKEIRGVRGASVAAPEFKAATDTHTIGSVYDNLLTTVDRNVVTGVRRRLVLADLLGSGTLTGNAIQYFVEGALEGGFATVAEGGAKPQIHVADPTTVTETLKKIAGFIKLSDEMMEDLDFVVSEINGRLLYELALFEESQLLSGDGTGSNLSGILDRSIQTMDRGAIADDVSAADALFKAMTAVSTGSGLDADGVVIHPADYQSLRLGKDGNGQYYGGGYFTGEYGNGGITEQPPVWGLRTVVTPAVTAGTAVVGAFAQAATVYRKGGVRVESTNSDGNDFTNNLVTVRAEERLALAVRKPAGFVSVNLADPVA